MSTTTEPPTAFLLRIKLTLLRRKASTAAIPAEAAKKNRLRMFMAALGAKRTFQKAAQSVHASYPCMVRDDLASVPSSTESKGSSRSSSLKTIRQPNTNILLSPGFKLVDKRHEEIHPDDHFLAQIHVTQHPQSPVILCLDEHSTIITESPTTTPETAAAFLGPVESTACPPPPPPHVPLSYDPPIYRHTRVRGGLPTRARSMFRPFDKEHKAITVWRDAVAQQWRPSSALDVGKKSYGSPSKNLATCKFIIHEIYTTEQTYHNLLKLIQTRYMEPMLAASQSKDPLVRSGDIPVLFGHLPELVAVSEEILARFSIQPRNDLTPGDVAGIFRQLENELFVFLRYAMHYQSHAKTIRRACNNVLFVKIDQETQTSRDTNRMSMADFFIAPIQRVPRYCLLLKDLLQHIPASNPDAQSLDIALKTMTGLATAMNLMQKQKPIHKQTL